MRRCWVMTILIGVAVAAGGCREDDGTGPGPVSYLVPSTAQCVATRADLSETGPPIVQSRLASALLAEAASSSVHGPSGALVCLSMEAGRWRMGPRPGADP